MRGGARPFRRRRLYDPPRPHPPQLSATLMFGHDAARRNSGCAESGRTNRQTCRVPYTVPADRRRGRTRPAPHPRLRRRSPASAPHSARTGRDTVRPAGRSARDLLRVPPERSRRPPPLRQGATVTSAKELPRTALVTVRHAFHCDLRYLSGPAGIFTTPCPRC